MKTSITNRLLPFFLLSLTTLMIGVVAHVNQARAVADQPEDKNEIVDAIVAHKRPQIEVVFVLDTTSSMSGMIQAAKENIWSIASTMASAQPAPEIKMGLVAFRDRGDAYVTKVFDLSDDLDGMYATLMDFKPQGGGDGPESVNQALHDAVSKISWSDNRSSYKAIFLVGDAPPHMDYQNDVKFPQSIASATRKGIVVNTIQAGQDVQTTRAWRKIASLSQGRYFNVDDEGAHVAIATPFDGEIAALSKELDETRFFYGAAEERAMSELKTAASEKLHAIASAASRAKRALFNASESGVNNFRGNKELVEDIRSGAVALDELADAELPESIRALPAPERQEEIDRQAKKREDISAKIAALAKQRQAYVEKELADVKDLADSLDHQIYETVAEQAKEKGLRYEGGPKY